MRFDYLALEKALESLEKGLLVVVPTETVYGLAADGYNDKAVARIYALKQRPSFNPLILHYYSAERVLNDVVADERFFKLAEAFWPGPLTIVVKRRDDSKASPLATAGLETLAVRVPSHPLLRSLLEKYPHPLAAPSANPSTRISPTHLQHVLSYFEGSEHVGTFLEGGLAQVGLESTVVDISSKTPAILRPGIITKEALEEVLGPIDEGDHTTSIKAPGQMKKHYAPSLPLRLNATMVREDEALLAFGPQVLNGSKCVMNLSEEGNLLEAASNLFRFLHELDSKEFSAIAVMPIPNVGVGKAINDRLMRANAHENEDSL